jgi:hypothetical protein
MANKLFEKKPNSKKTANYREITFQFALNENVTTTVVALACPDHFDVV